MRIIVLLLALVAAAAITLPAGPAWAHARVERAEPAADSVVQVSPPEIRLWVSQELRLRGNDVVVTDADGQRIDNGDAQVDQRDPSRKQLVVTLPPLAAGTYTVTYTTLSAEDDHPFTDSFAFTVAPSAAPAPVEGAERQ